MCFLTATVLAAARQPLLCDFVRLQHNHGMYLWTVGQALTAALKPHPIA